MTSHVQCADSVSQLSTDSKEIKTSKNVSGSLGSQGEVMSPLVSQFGISTENVNVEIFQYLKHLEKKIDAIERVAPSDPCTSTDLEISNKREASVDLLVPVLIRLIIIKVNSVLLLW